MTLSQWDTFQLWRSIAKALSFRAEITGSHLYLVCAEPQELFCAKLSPALNLAGKQAVLRGAASMKGMVVWVLLTVLVILGDGRSPHANRQASAGRRQCHVVVAVDLGTFVSARRLHVAMNYQRIGLYEYMDSFARVVADGRERIMCSAPR